MGGEFFEKRLIILFKVNGILIILKNISNIYEMYLQPKSEDFVPFFFGYVILAGVMLLGLNDMIRRFPDRAIAFLLALYFSIGIGLIRFSGLEMAGQLGDFFNPFVTTISVALAFYAFSQQNEKTKDEAKHKMLEQKIKLVNDILLQVQQSLNGITKIVTLSNPFLNVSSAVQITGAAAIQDEINILKTSTNPAKSLVAKIISLELLSLTNVRSIFLSDKNIPDEIVTVKMQVTNGFYETYIEEYAKQYVKSIDNAYVSEPAFNHKREFLEGMRLIQEQNELFIKLFMNKGLFKL